MVYINNITIYSHVDIKRLSAETLLQLGYYCQKVAPTTAFQYAHHHNLLNWIFQSLNVRARPRSTATRWRAPPDQVNEYKFHIYIVSVKLQRIWILVTLSLYHRWFIDSRRTHVQRNLQYLAVVPQKCGWVACLWTCLNVTAAGCFAAPTRYGWCASG